MLVCISFKSCRPASNWHVPNIQDSGASNYLTTCYLIYFYRCKRCRANVTRTRIFTYLVTFLVPNQAGSQLPITALCIIFTQIFYLKTVTKQKTRHLLKSRVRLFWLSFCLTWNLFEISNTPNSIASTWIINPRWNGNTIHAYHRHRHNSAPCRSYRVVCVY